MERRRKKQLVSLRFTNDHIEHSLTIWMRISVGSLIRRLFSTNCGDNFGDIGDSVVRSDIVGKGIGEGREEAKPII